jgi:glutamyl-Q tRNA(Asp) synthetase
VLNVSDTSRYIGRFAPSPTGSLHLGSLYTALASFLDAKAQQGLWLLRIDDLDTPRNTKDAAGNILTTLEAFGLQWDDEVYYQSHHISIYNDILATLQHHKLIYPCTCSRKTLTTSQSNTATEIIYPNNCRDNTFPCPTPHALRIKTDNRNIAFNDHIIAYQFAVVIDDDRQSVNHVVRGMDLLDSTTKQIYLQQRLGLSTPNYLHVPIIADEQGFKLSKQTKAQAVDLKSPTLVIFKLLHLLKQQPPVELRNASAAELLNWAITHWNPAALKPIAAIPLDD